MRTLFDPRFKIEKPSALEELSENAESLVPAFSLDADNKADVLIALLGIYHNSASFWTSRAYQMTILYVGLIHASVAYFFLHPTIPWASRILLSVGLLVFGFLMHGYLKRALRAHDRSHRAISKCEAALRLHQPGEYINDHRFLPNSKGKLQSKDLQFLSYLQLFSTIGVVCFVIVEGFMW
jgi:hypothetical protein